MKKEEKNYFLSQGFKENELESLENFTKENNCKVHVAIKEDMDFTELSCWVTLCELLKDFTKEEFDRITEKMYEKNVFISDLIWDENIKEIKKYV